MFPSGKITCSHTSSYNHVWVNWGFSLFFGGQTWQEHYSTGTSSNSLRNIDQSGHPSKYPPIHLGAHPLKCPSIHSPSLIAIHLHSPCNIYSSIHHSKHLSNYPPIHPSPCWGQHLYGMGSLQHRGRQREGRKKRIKWKEVWDRGSLVCFCERHTENREFGEKERWCWKDKDGWVAVPEGAKCLCWPLISIPHIPASAQRVNSRHSLLFSLFLPRLPYPPHDHCPFQPLLC